MKKRLLALVVTCMVAGTAFAQDFLTDPKWGETPAQREENVKLYNAFQYSYTLKDFGQATIELKILLANAPKCSENLYIRGSEIYRNKLARAKSKEERLACVDSIMLLFDLRAENFGDHATRGRSYILGQKAMAFYTYSPEDRTKAYELFRQAIDADIVNVDPELACTFFTSLTDSYKLDDITSEDYVGSFEYVTAALAANENPEAAEALKTVEGIFATSGAADCEGIEKIFRPKYEADSNNPELIKKILGLFQRSKCSGDFYMELIEKYYSIDPKPELALMLAGVYEEKKDYNKALEFINVAIASETDPKLKISYLVRAAGQTLALENYRAAADMARQVMGMDKENSYAYFIYASALAGGVNQACGDFERQAAYWLVVDAFQQAKSRMSADSPQMASANQAIASFASNFPKEDELFMRDLASGQGYTVNCGWISGRTTVRGR